MRAANAASRGRTHYFLGRSSESWVAGVPMYAKARYEDVRPGPGPSAGRTNILSGIDLVNAIPGAEGTSGGANNAAILAKLSVEGSRALVWTGFGGGDVEYSYGIGIDANCQAYITGETDSKDFVTANPFQAQSASPAGSADRFVTKIDPAIETGEPSVGCNGVVEANDTPVLRQGAANSPFIAVQ